MSPSNPSSAAVAFLRDLIRIPSLPGEEGEIAGRVASEMRALDFDEVSLDEAGNVVGLVRGEGDDAAPSVMFNTHLDHVDAGDPEAWPHAPFAAELADGRVWGRGAVDIKGPMAAQVHGIGHIARRGPRPPGDVFVTAVVQEEIGGVGARHLIDHLSPDLVLVGEPSSNTLRRGHRGRAELEVHVRGRSAHASVPDRGVNPLYRLADFLRDLPDVEMPADATLGRATVAPTLIRTDQRSANVIPGEAWLTLDCRLVPGQTAEELRERLAGVLARRDGDAEAEIRVPVTERTTYTGLEMRIPADNPAYVLSEDDPAVTSARSVLAGSSGEAPPVGVWRFATDGGHFANAGMTVIGLGPGAEELAHTVDESVETREVEAAVEAYELLAREWPARYAAGRNPGSG